MSYTDLNESFNRKYKVSDELLKEELALKNLKSESKTKFLESIDRSLTERHWKFTVPGNYRNAIFEAGDEEDFDDVRYALMDICQYVIDHIEESEDFEQEELEMIIDDYSDLLEELDYQDFEDEDECNYWLNELYDLMDATDVFLGLRESINETIEPFYSGPARKGNLSDISEVKVGDKVVNSAYDGVGVIDEIKDGKLYIIFPIVKGRRIFDNSNIQYLSKVDECLKEDTVKQNDKWVNKGEEGTHGTFKTKKEADAQRKAMFANGYKESLKESLDQNEINNAVYHALADVCFEFNKKGNHPTEEEIDLAYDWFATHFWDSDDYMECLNEGAAVSKITIPEPYNEYFKISDADPSSEGYEVGEELSDYNCHFLALLDPKKVEVEGIYPILTDDPEYPVVEDVMGSLMPVELPLN